MQDAAPAPAAVAPQVAATLDKARTDIATAKAKRTPKPKKLSRADRWQAAVSDAKQALEELLSIQREYQDWRDNMNENLQSSPTGEKLEAVCDLDIQGAIDTVDECENADLPLGFGRD